MSDMTKSTKQGKWGFGLKSIEDLRRLAGGLGVQMEAIEDVSILAEPVEAGGLIMANSLAIHPMEAADGDCEGRPGELTFRRYERFAAGGAGLIWVEAISVVPEGRANPRQLWLNEDSREGFAALIRQIRQTARNGELHHKPVIVAQLTHSGRYSKPEGRGHPLILQRDPYRDALTLQHAPDASAKSKIPDNWQVLTDEYLDGLVDAYVTAAKIAFEIGFDAVDIKSCHGYLVGELLVSRRRQGKYGGPFENRVRFLLGVIDRIHAELGEDKQVVTRLGVYDAVPYPFGWGVDENDCTRADLVEPKKLIALLVERGVRLINISIANPHYNPHYGRPFIDPIIGSYQSPEHPLSGVGRLISLAGEIQKGFSEIAVVGTGYSWLRTLMANVAAASKKDGLASIIGVGRMAFAYPDFAKDIILKGRLDAKKVCVACSKCSQIMVDGGRIGCVVRDREVYGPIYEEGRMISKDS
ncbi:MAG: oxidoreductase [Planctomycetota bacterium]|jgi:2,4-dienoyl-CoA reductase-like NADH-dependent reductase (Old Yellow Enzyme family)